MRPAPARVVFAARRTPLILNRTRCNILMGRHVRAAPIVASHYHSLSWNKRHRITMHKTICSRNHSSGKAWDHYEVLGLDMTDRLIDQSKIKRAYFEKAKQCHPDLHPNDPKATAKFREVSEAYEVLGNPDLRDQYDTLGHEVFYETQQPRAGGASAGNYHRQDDFHQAETFQRVWQEYYKYEINPYIKQVQEEISDAISAMYRGDYTPAWEFAKNRPGLILGVVVPLGAVLRFPWLITGAFGIVMRVMGTSLYVLGMLEYFLPPGTKRELANYLWRQMIAAAARTHRAQQKRYSSRSQSQSQSGSQSQSEQKTRSRERRPPGSGRGW